MDKMIEQYIWEFVQNYLDAVEHEAQKEERARKRRIDWIEKRRTNYHFNTWRSAMRKNTDDPHSLKKPEHRVKGLHGVEEVSEVV